LQELLEQRLPLGLAPPAGSHTPMLADHRPLEAHRLQKVTPR